MIVREVRCGSSNDDAMFKFSNWICFPVLSVLVNKITNQIKPHQNWMGFIHLAAKRTENNFHCAANFGSRARPMYIFFVLMQRGDFRLFWCIAGCHTFDYFGLWKHCNRHHISETNDRIWPVGSGLSFLLNRCSWLTSVTIASDQVLLIGDYHTPQRHDLRHRFCFFGLKLCLVPGKPMYHHALKSCWIPTRNLIAFAMHAFTMHVFCCELCSFATQDRHGSVHWQCLLLWSSLNYGFFI